LGSEHPFIRPEAVCSILAGVAKKAVRDWTNMKKIPGVLNGTQISKGFPTRTLC
jgi:hypothetical protein